MMPLENAELLTPNVELKDTCGRRGRPGGVILRRWLELVTRNTMRRTRLSMRDIEQELENQGYPKNHELFKFAAVLVATIETGPDVEEVTTITGYSLEFVRMIAVRMSAAEMWGELPTVHDTWFDPEQGAVNFLLDTMVAAGELTTAGWQDGKRVYCAVMPN